MDENQPPDPQELKEMVDEPPIVRVTDLIISQAILDGATHVHLDPGLECIRVRYRVGLQLDEVMNPPKHVYFAVVARLKIMANMDIAEWRVPQFGEIRLTVDNREYDITVHSFPCVSGEKMVLQIQDRNSAARGLEELGLSNSNLEHLKSVLQNRSGLVLLSGGQRSGKNTALRACAQHLFDKSKSIYTIERRVTHRLDGVNQIQLNPKVGLTADSILRWLADGDTEIIALDRLQHGELAKRAFDAASSDRLVLTATYQSGAAAALTRILDMYVERHLVAEALLAIWAQRLLPQLCQICRVKQAAPEGIEGLRKGETIFSAPGCSICRDSGFQGLIGTQELLLSSPDLRQAIREKARTEDLQKFVEVPMREDALSKLKSGKIGLLDFLKAFGS
jgi:type II secretory ATPase GspE/PulE/Tfp pilus assembly ATPase PilB-like protein